ncbi:MAG TPA: hypothetical protein EYN66_17745 [Myxococcales bacterium]|nr:hypothetical protein [Myxococcales bacterium]
MKLNFNRWLLGLCLLTFVVAMFRFDGPAKGYWDTYITAPAMFMNKTPVNFVLKDGKKAFDTNLKGVLPDDLVNKDDFGIITKDQRLGGGISAALSYGAMRQLGFRVLFALALTLMIPLTVLLWRRFDMGSDWAGLSGGLVLAWNPYMLNVDRLNANAFSMPLMLLTLYLLVLKPARPIILGLVFGVLAGIRNEAVCFVPAIIYWMLKRDEETRFGQRFIQLFVVGVCTVIALSPILYWKWYAFGHPLMHPSQYPHFQGFRPEFAHSLFGLDFTFNGLFNWPLHTELVRTPHFGYPTYLLFPLVTIRALGLVVSALALLGAGLLFTHRRSMFWLMFAWMAPVYLLFGPQENWEEVKMTFMLLAWPPIGVFVAAGVAPFTGRIQLKRRLITLGFLVVALFGGVQLVGAVDAPQDERWYVRFPNADKNKNPAAQEGLAEEERNDWVYFQSYENSEEIARERAKLTAAWPWPARYLPLNWEFGREWDEMCDEASRKELTVLEIWGYIYGTRR